MQPVAMNMIANAVKKDRVAHAYLFEGRKGTGKKAAALFFAKMLFCTDLREGFLPCGRCLQCRRIDSGNHPDLLIIEADGASIKTEQIALLREEFAKKAVESDRKMYIIENAEKMTASASNRLLKFLEEPPAKTTAILITENVHQILPTVRSRCQHIPFRSRTKSGLISLLIERGISEEKAPLFAQLTNDAEEALKLSRDEWFLQGKGIVIKLYEILNSKSLADALLFVEQEWLPHFKEREQMDLGLTLLLYIYRDALFIRLGRTGSLVFPGQLEKWKHYAVRKSEKRLAAEIQEIIEAKKRLQSNANGALLMEWLIRKLREGSVIV